jgi:DNA-binding GntR family transcriptional regulator
LTSQPANGPRKGPMVTEVYHLIFGMLISQEIPPGARMAVDEIARKLGVSQTPVRQALATLEAEGLVTRTHLVGYRAGELMTRRQFDDLFAVRVLLEPQAARLAAEKPAPETLADMRSTQSEMTYEASRNGVVPYGTFARHDAELHSAIAEASRNEALRDAVSRLNAHVHLFRLYVDRAVTHDALDEHEEIVSAIEHRDPRRAAAAMRAHLRRSQKRLRSAFE